jgi:competence protein ComEC
LKFATALALLFGISQIDHYSRYAESSEFSVIDISNRAVIDFRKGFKSKMISDTLFEKELAKQEFNLHPKRLLTGSAQETQDDLLEFNEASSSLGRFFSFEGKIILYLDQQVTDRFNPEEPIVVDCLILGKNAVSQLSYLKGKVVYTKLIIDPTNSWFVDRELSKESEQLQIDYHSVRQNGYYSETWNSSL